MKSIESNNCLINTGFFEHSCRKIKTTFLGPQSIINRFVDGLLLAKTHFLTILTDRVKWRLIFKFEKDILLNLSLTVNH